MKVKEFLKSTVGKVSIGIIIVLGVVIMAQYPASTKKVFEEYKETYDVAVFEKYYDGKGLFGKLEKKRGLEVAEMAIDYLNNNMIAATGGSFEDLKNVKIEKVEISSLNYSYRSKYTDVNTTIKNNSDKNIQYIKINLYFKDGNGDIVKSEWTNDSSTIKPGASQTISKMTNKEGWEVVSAEIDEVKFK